MTKLVANIRDMLDSPIPTDAEAAQHRYGREERQYVMGQRARAVIGSPATCRAALEELATRLKKLCGAGGAVKDGLIEIQGDHRDRLVAELCKLGYDAKRSGG